MYLQLRCCNLNKKQKKLISSTFKRSTVVMSSDSDSSEDDLSRFKDVVDNSFVEISQAKQDVFKSKPASERYLVQSGHHNDISVSQYTQRIIGNKLSAMIQKKIKFVDTPHKIIRHKVKGGVKLFKDSKNYLTCQDVVDTETLEHNKKSKKFRRKQKHVDDYLELDENEKIKLSVVNGEDVMLKDEIKHWKSRRKEKVFKYRTMPNSRVLQAIE